MKRIFVLLCIMFASCVVFAQKNVSGIVKDRNGDPLIGANVYVKGTTISTISGINGEFNIRAADDAVLVINFEGYYDLEVAVADLATADLQLKPEKLIGTAAYYGNDNYYAATTANTLINIDDIATGLETDIYQYLLGKVPGLEIVPDASGSAYYRMRGGDSPTGEVTEPLFVVDGMYDFGGNMTVSALNPNDIESIRVLKDATATAHYGEYGRNGVVVIKTRRPSDKVLAVTYDGNASLNTTIGTPINDSIYDYNDSYSTKHNVAVAGLVGPMPYRASLGYNSIGGIVESERNNRISGSAWLGPRLLDKHLNIDFSSYFRNYNYSFGDDKHDYNYLAAVLKTDYSVHSFEDLHVNLFAGYNSNLDKNSALVLDGNIALLHQFGKNYYVELRAGGASYNYNSEWDSQPNTASIYGNFNLALNRYYLNFNTRYNAFDGVDYGKFTTALSMGVRAGSSVMLRTGFGISGVTAGDCPDGVNSFEALSYNFGVEWGTAKSLVYGSADFYIHNNEEQYHGEDYSYKTMSLDNVGVDFRIGARLVDNKIVKWRIGANLAVNASFILGADEYTDTYVEFVPDEKPMTFYVYEPVYDQSGNRVHGMFVDHNGDMTLNSGDRLSSERSPLPTVIGGFNTYIEVKGVYLQVNAHGSAERYNVTTDIWDNYILADDVHNSSFLRIDNVLLGYNFTDLWLMSGRAYFAVQNPYVYTKYSGREPEIYNGVDGSGIRQRPTIFSVGVKLNINIKD